MSWYMGLDSSTQGLTAVVIDGAAGVVVRARSVSFGADLPEYGCPFGVLPNPDPLVKEANPLLWCAALDLLLSRLKAEGVDLARVDGIGGSG